MTRTDEREIARRLADTPAGEAPPELLDRLLADIPDDLTAAHGDDVAETAETTSPPARRRGLSPFGRPGWAVAAVLAMMVGGGFLAWKLSQQVEPLDQTHVDAPARVESTAKSERAESMPRSRAAVDPAAAAAAVDGAEERRPSESDAGEESEAPSPSLILTGEETGAEESASRSAAERRSAAEPLATRQAGNEVGGPTEPVSPAATDPVLADPVLADSVLADSVLADSVLKVRVTHQDEAIPGALVEVRQGGTRHQEVVDAQGTARFDDLPPGDYEVKGSLEGFSTVIHPSVKVDADSEVVEEALELPLATVEEEIVVMAPTPESDSASVTGSATGSATLSTPASDRSARSAQRAPRSPAPAPPPPARPAPAARDLENLSVIRQNQEIAHLRDEARRLEREMAELERAEPPEPVFHPVVETSRDHLSTFGLDVDTGSYNLVRGSLQAGRRPPVAAVRVEEVVNALPFSDPFAERAAAADETFRVIVDGAPSPFSASSSTPASAHRLLRFRIATPELPPARRTPAILTLVVDVSGSMEGQRLSLVRAGVGRLLEALGPGDRVALVTFADEARVVARHGEPLALRRAARTLTSEGGTNAEAGLRVGYELATEAFDPAAANRVILLSDGLPNLGAVAAETLLEAVARAARDGIELTTVGVGMAARGDHLMETLANRGDGRYTYTGDRRDMERLFVEELGATLNTVAEEARAQVEFDARFVESWRQVGYENRALADHEFRYDAVDAGEIGPGHSVTALYEVKLRLDEEGRPLAGGRPLALLKLRWRQPAADDGRPGRFREIEVPLTGTALASTWATADAELRLAAVAAELAEQLRGSPHATTALARLTREAGRLADERVPGAGELADLVAAWVALEAP